MNYGTLPAEFTSPSVLVTVEDAIAYAHDVTAGFDGLLLELRDKLTALPVELTLSQRRAICQYIDDQIQAAREGLADAC